MPGILRNLLQRAIVLGLALWGLLSISCNVEPNVEHKVDIRLPDSLSSDLGKYDSLIISIEHPDGRIISPRAFHGPFLYKPTEGVLKDLVIGKKTPAVYVLEIEAYQGGKSAVYQITVADKKQNPILTVVALPPRPDTLTRVEFVRPAPILYVGGPKRRLAVAHEPDSLAPALEFGSGDSGIIAVSQSGEAEARAEGFATLTVSAPGSSTVRDTLRVQAKKDVPVLDAGGDRIAVPGQPVRIEVKVTQEFGTLTLSWDFDGDGRPEDSTTRDTATASHTYAAEGAHTATFIAKDGEGNADTAEVRIRVGTGPVVRITSPMRDTVVNTPEFTVRYTSDSRPLTRVFTLREGLPTVLTVKDSNDFGIDSASVTVTLDTTAPVVRITAPSAGLLTNLPEIAVAWTVDGVAQSQKTRETLAGRQGRVVITREYADSAGNVGGDSIAIHRDTLPPSAPIFTGTDTASRSKRPAWAWVSGGGGNGVFMIQFNAQSALETTAKSFTPSADLNDSSHTLRVRERDTAGNWSAWSARTIRVSTAGPAAPAFDAGLTTSSPTKNKKPTWAWVSSGTNGGGAGAFRWSVNTPTPDSGEGAALRYTPAADLPDGNYILTLQECDSLGNWSAPAARAIRIFTAGALVEITAPVRGSLFNAKNGEVAVSWSVDGTPQTSLLRDTLTLEGAWNGIRREYRDSAGIVSFDTVSVFWDTTAPKVAITSPANGAWVNSPVVPVSWSVDSRAQAARTADTLAGPDGAKTITRSATDAAGNTGTAAVTVNLDREAPAAPTVSVSPSSPTDDRTPTWSWSGSGPFEFRYGTANPPATNLTRSDASSFTPSSALAPGTWYFQVRERDAAMNWSAWSAADAIVLYRLPDSTMPAARQHVRIVEGKAYKFTSKLARIVELNFTMGFDHLAGKAIVTSALKRIASTYGTQAFPLAVQSFTGPNGGGAFGAPNFTQADLLGGQVIVANNVSQFGHASLGSQRQTAISAAIESQGRGYLGIHGSGDNTQTDWPWYTSTLHPVDYRGHGPAAVAPVYKHLEQAGHVVLENVLKTRTTLAADVPDELDAGGSERLAADVPIRMMKGEWHRYGRDLTRDAAFRDKVVPLLKYDARNIDTAIIPRDYKRAGGNIFTSIYTVGNGLTSYLPSGHDNAELLDPSTGFDGGAGDLDRYMAQLMFYLAGYTSSACDASCLGLEVVDGKNHQLTGMRYASTGMMGPMGAPSYRAVLADRSGRVVRRFESKGAVTPDFATGHLDPGVYFLKVTAGGRPVRIMRFAIM